MFPRCSTGRAVGYVEAYELDGDALRSALALYPMHREAIMDVGERRLVNDLKKVRP